MGRVKEFKNDVLLTSKTKMIFSNETVFDDGCQYFEECEDYHQLEESCWCQFSQNTSSCELDDVFVQYVHVFLCKDIITLAWIIGMNILYALWVWFWSNSRCSYSI